MFDASHEHQNRDSDRLNGYLRFLPIARDIWIKRHLNLAFEPTSSAKIYASSTAALAATLATQYLIPGGHILQLATGIIAFALVYFGALKITHTLTKQDYDMFRSIL
jgi:hypothetical protein